MARYSVRIKTSAVKELEAVAPKKKRQRLVRRIGALGEEPRPRGCQKLAAEGERYRVRQGNYRIVYSINDHDLVVQIVKIGHRKEIYR